MIFAITKVDKLSHNLALICKKLYLHKRYSEIHLDALQQHRRIATLSSVVIRTSTQNTATNTLITYLTYMEFQRCTRIRNLFEKKTKIAGVANVEVPVVNNHDTWLQKAFYNKRSTPIYSTTSGSKKLGQALQDVMSLLQEKDHIFFRLLLFRRCGLLDVARKCLL